MIWRIQKYFIKQTEDKTFNSKLILEFDGSITGQSVAEWIEIWINNLLKKEHSTM